MIIVDTLKPFSKNIFDPLKDESSLLPNGFGIYFICIKNKAALPYQMIDLQYTTFDGYPVIYIGMSGKQGIKRRDYTNHFTGLARSSTLRKSLGSLLGYRRYYYDDKKYRFIQEDENILSEWMKENLLFIYYKIGRAHV